MNKSYVSIAAVFVLVVGAIAFLFEKPSAKPLSANSFNTTIILDRTVSDRTALISETEEALNGLIKEIAQNGDKYFGAEIRVVFADDAGEHSATWKVAIPPTFGVKKIGLRKALVAINQYKEATLETLKKDTKQYQKSLLLESVSRELEHLDRNDKLIIVSDMCVVDNSGNNFEREIFAQPPALNAKAAVVIHPIGRKGQRLEAIRLIEAWWEDALHGTNTFADLHSKPKQLNSALNKTMRSSKYTLKKPTNKVTSKSTVAQTDHPKQFTKSGIIYDEPGELDRDEHISNDFDQDGAIPTMAATPTIVEGTKEIIRMNERKMAALSDAISPCLAGIPAGNYTFRIEVTSSGLVSKLVAIEQNASRVATCLKESMAGASFETYPNSQPYFFEETIEIAPRTDS